MMAHPNGNVKRPRPYPRRFAPLLEWIDGHPRTGWYVVSILFLNFTLSLLDLLDFDPLWFAR